MIKLHKIKVYEHVCPVLMMSEINVLHSFTCVIPLDNQCVGVLQVCFYLGCSSRTTTRRNTMFSPSFKFPFSICSGVTRYVLRHRLILSSSMMWGVFSYSRTVIFPNSPMCTRALTFRTSLFINVFSLFLSIHKMQAAFGSFFSCISVAVCSWLAEFFSLEPQAVSSMQRKRMVNIVFMAVVYLKRFIYDKDTINLWKDSIAKHFLSCHIVWKMLISKLIISVVLRNHDDNPWNSDADWRNHDDDLVLDAGLL